MKMLSAFIFVVCTLFTNALLAESKIFVDSASAEKAIRDTYGAMRTKYDKQYFIESTDDEILENTLKEYNHMLFESGGFVTSSGLALVCAVPFYDFEPRQISAFKYKELDTLINVKCAEFMKALRQVVPNPNCQYDISTVNGSSLRVKYTRKSDKSGFIRKCDNYAAWRFFNPGNLRDSEDKCTTLRTNKSGSFAVFSDERTGCGALEKLSPPIRAFFYLVHNIFVGFESLNKKSGEKLSFSKIKKGLPNKDLWKFQICGIDSKAGDTLLLSKCRPI